MHDAHKQRLVALADADLEIQRLSEALEHARNAAREARCVVPIHLLQGAPYVLNASDGTTCLVSGDGRSGWKTTKVEAIT